MAAPIEFYFEFASPYGYLASLRMPGGRMRAAAATYREVEARVPGKGAQHVLFGGASYYVGLGEIAFEQNDLILVERLLTSALAFLEGTMAIDADLILRLIEIFAEDSRKMLAALRDGIAGRTPDDVMHAAHRLKGSLATLGAETAADLAHRLERLGADGNLAGAEDTLARLQNELGLLDVELATLRDDALARRA